MGSVVTEWFATQFTVLQHRNVNMMGTVQYCMIRSIGHSQKMGLYIYTHVIQFSVVWPEADGTSCPK